MQYKLFSPAGHLEDIEKFLTTHAIPESTELDTILKQLFKIKQSVGKALKSHDKTFSTHFTEQKELVKKLAGRCQKLQERRSVINLAEEAEELANTSPLKSPDEIALKAQDLQNRIERFLERHRPSRNNAKFIRFAKACIEKAKKHEPVLTSKSPKQVSLELARKNVRGPVSVEIAESLYELSSLLYQEKTEEFLSYFSQGFSLDTQKELHYHISVCSGHVNKLSKKEERMKVIQGILGYAHLLADYYMDNTPYPTIVEINRMFQELDLVNQQEQEDLRSQ